MRNTLLGRLTKPRGLVRFGGAYYAPGTRQDHLLAEADIFQPVFCRVYQTWFGIWCRYPWELLVANEKFELERV